MAEDSESPKGSGADVGEAADPVAISLALGAAAHDERVAAKAEAFLDQQTHLAQKQSAIADLQIEDLKREDKLRHWSLRVRHVSDVLKLGFELAVGFIVLAIAIGVGAVIWQAAHAEGLVIRSFEVPQTLVERGLTGQVIANKLLDRLAVMQAQTDSTRAASSFANDWTNDIKVEIPDTGISLGEAVRFLDGWLGHEMHLSGELYETSSGIALTVRMDNNPGQTFEGKPGDLDRVVARAAEAVYGRAQPYRYQNYLARVHRPDESAAVGHALAAAGPRNETAWAYNGLGIAESYKDDIETARRYFAAAQMANPDLPNSYLSLGNMEADLGHDEAALVDRRRGVALLNGPGAREWNPDAIMRVETSYAGHDAMMHGDFLTALRDNVEAAGDGRHAVAKRAALIAIGMHDIAAAHRRVADMPAMPGNPTRLPFDRTEMLGRLLTETQDWHGAIAQFEAAAQQARISEADSKGWASATYLLRTGVLPYEAHAYAMLGSFDKANEILKTLPADCDICARTHGQVEAARKNWNAAAYWFRLVSARSPDIPFADTDWGAMLLAKGDYDAAIEKFRAASLKGPHFADPLELWGEALMQKNRSDLALAKFEEANKYAPNWGRLHLKWGEALLWSGDKDGARKQFAIASALYLTPTEKAALQRIERIHV